MWSNGRPTTARSTAPRIRLIRPPPSACGSPSPRLRSPESNGIAEAFAKTLKRDYTNVTLLPDAPTILRLVASWIDDYKTCHPHSGLRMLLPQEFRAITLNDVVVFSSREYADNLWVWAHELEH